MPIDVVCRGCGNTYQVSRKLAGKRVRCKGCGGGIGVPGAVAATVATEEGGADGEYDLSALAAAENAAEALEERVYVPPTVEKPAKKQAKRGVTTVADTGRVGQKVEETGWRWVVAQPWLYVHVAGLVLVLAACVGGVDVAQGAMAMTGVAALGMLVWAYWGLLVATFDDNWLIIALAMMVPLVFWVALAITLCTKAHVYRKPGLMLLNAVAFFVYFLLIFQANPALHAGTKAL